MAKGFKNSIENIYNRIMLYSIIGAVVTMIIGAILFFLPNVSNKVIGIIVGINFLLSGINSIYKYFHRDGAKIYSLSILFGALFTVLGVVIILYPFKVVEFVTVCLGLYFLINGATKINNGVWLKIGNEDSWLITLSTGILLLIIGLLVIFNPFVTLTLTKLSGIFVFISGGIDLMDAILLKTRSKEVIEIFW